MSEQRREARGHDGVTTRKLYEAVKGIERPQDEWFAATMFLPRTGHMCNEWRQGFFLLSDVLGVSMLVDAVNSRKAVEPIGVDRAQAAPRCGRS